MNEAVLALLLSAGAYDAHAKYALAMATENVKQSRPVAAKIVAYPQRFVGVHSHKCPKCKGEFTHDDPKPGPNQPSHACPFCGFDQKFWPIISQGTRPVETPKPAPVRRQSRVVYVDEQCDT